MRAGGLAVLYFLPPMAPNLDFALEGVLWLAAPSAASGDLVLSLVLFCGFLPPIIPSFEVTSFELACLGWAVLRSDSDSVSESVAAFGDEDSFLETFLGLSGDSETDFSLETGEGLLLIPPSVPSFDGRGRKLVSRLRTTAGGELEELDRRNALSSFLPASEESESSSRAARRLSGFCFR